MQCRTRSLNTDTALSYDYKLGSLDLVLVDHLGRVHFIGLKFNLKYCEVKVLEMLAICLGMEGISSIHILNLMIESDCLEGVKLLKDEVIDLFEVSFFIDDQAKVWSCELSVISSTHVHRCYKCSGTLSSSIQRSKQIL